MSNKIDYFYALQLKLLMDDEQRSYEIEAVDQQNSLPQSNVDADYQFSVNLHTQLRAEDAKNNDAEVLSVAPQDNSGKEADRSQSVSRNDVDYLSQAENWVLIDPTTNIRAMFVSFNEKFFQQRLSSVVVEWSKRLRSRPAICYQRCNPLFKEIIIRLSEPLLMPRPYNDLVNILLHEMIHAYCFVLNIRDGNGGHGPNFRRIMDTINKMAGTNITVYHNFQDDVKKMTKTDTSTSSMAINDINEYEINALPALPSSSSAETGKDELSATGSVFFSLPDENGEIVTWESYDEDVMLRKVSVPTIIISDSDDEEKDKVNEVKTQQDNPSTAMLCKAPMPLLAISDSVDEVNEVNTQQDKPPSVSQNIWHEVMEDEFQYKETEIIMIDNGHDDDTENPAAATNPLINGLSVFKSLLENNQRENDVVPDGTRCSDFENHLRVSTPSKPTHNTTANKEHGPKQPARTPIRYSPRIILKKSDYKAAGIAAHSAKPSNDEVTPRQLRQRNLLNLYPFSSQNYQADEHNQTIPAKKRKFR